MLLEPETRYIVESVERNKPGFEGITWITAKVTNPSPVIEDLIKRVDTVKKSKIK